MVTKIYALENKKYRCKDCDYNTSIKKDFDKHLKTKKHETRTNGYNEVTNCHVENDLSPDYICDCGRIYKYRQGLYRHKKTCNYSKEEQIIECGENKDELKSLIIKIMTDSSEKMNFLMNENKELRNQLKEQLKTEI
jgi:hypothetical protein